MEPGELIKKAREKRGWSQKDLADRVRISQVAIMKIETGATAQSKFLPKLAQVLELDLADLASNLKSQTFAAEAPVLRQHRPDFKVYASAEGGPGEIIRSAEPVDFVPRPSHLAHVQDAYGLLITGTSMEPEYNPGEMAIVEPSLPVVAGEVYIFYTERHGEARATIKKLRRTSPDKWLVSQHNPPDGKSKDFTLLKAEWSIVHRVTGKFARR